SRLKAAQRAPRRQDCPMSLSFRGAEHPAFIVGQDGILRAGWQPAPAALVTRDSGGLRTRRRLPTCPTTSAEFPFVRELSGIGQDCLHHSVRRISQETGP